MTLCVYSKKYIYIYTYIFWILLACYYVDVYSKDVNTCILQYQCKPVCNKMTSKHTFILYHKTKTTTTNNIEIIRKSLKLTWHTTHSSTLPACDVIHFATSTSATSSLCREAILPQIFQALGMWRQGSGVFFKGEKWIELVTMKLRRATLDATW